MRIIQVMALLVASVAADWGLWSCDLNGYAVDKQSQHQVNQEQFLGQWFEMYKDKDASFWSLTDCTTSFYENYVLGMSLHRLSHLKFFGWSIVTMNYISDSYYFLNLGGLFGNTWRIYEFWNLWGDKHEVLGADPNYEDWAVVYGCNDWIFGLFYTRYATLLSRSRHVTASTLRKAHFVLKDIKYDTDSLWVNPNIQAKNCDLSVEPSYQTQALDMFSTEPDWDYYRVSLKTTKRISEYYHWINFFIPSGIITSKIFFWFDTFTTPLQKQLMSSDYFKYYTISEVYLDTNKELKVDIKILTDGFSSDVNNEYFNKLEQDQAAGKEICCFEDIPNQEYSVKKHMNGFARVVYYSYQGGIKVLREGHFMDGIQNNFGRVVDLRKDDLELSFIGWFPQENEAGKGISKYGDKMFEGEFSSMREFGASSGDYQQVLNKYEIKSFDERIKAPWWQFFPN